MFISRKDRKELYLRLERLHKAEEEAAELKRELNAVNKRLESLLCCDTSIISTPLAVADSLISASYMRKCGELERIFTQSDVERTKCFTRHELREIANHLLVYCDAEDERECR